MKDKQEPPAASESQRGMRRNLPSTEVRSPSQAAPRPHNPGGNLTMAVVLLLGPIVMIPLLRIAVQAFLHRLMLRLDERPEATYLTALISVFLLAVSVAMLFRFQFRLPWYLMIRCELDRRPRLENWSLEGMFCLSVYLAAVGCLVAKAELAGLAFVHFAVCYVALRFTYRSSEQLRLIRGFIDVSSKSAAPPSLLTTSPLLLLLLTLRCVPRVGEIMNLCQSAVEAAIANCCHDFAWIVADRHQGFVAAGLMFAATGLFFLALAFLMFRLSPILFSSMVHSFITFEHGSQFEIVRQIFVLVTINLMMMNLVIHDPLREECAVLAMVSLVVLQCVTHAGKVEEFLGRLRLVR